MGVVLFSYIVAEIVVMVAVAKLIGGAAMLASMVAISLVGVFLVRHQVATLVTRSTPAPGGLPRPTGPPPLADHATRAFAGLLIAIPGFVSSMAGLALLLPPVRRSARSFVFARAMGWSGFTKRFDTEFVDVTLVDEHGSKPSQSTRRELG